MEATLKTILEKYGNDKTRLMDILLEVQAKFLCVTNEAAAYIAEELGISQVDVKQTRSFYHFFSEKPVGKYAIYLNNSAVANMMGRAEVVDAFEKETGILFNNVTQDGLVGLWDTADIGMNDQEPAALINNVVFPNLNPEKVMSIMDMIKEGKSAEEMIGDLGDGQNANPLVQAQVNNNIKKYGPVIFAEHKSGSSLEKALQLTELNIIEEVKDSNLRGRGGAGFPTGLKLEFVRRAAGTEKYLVCNADEGEPGTFKERTILTEIPRVLFEGMAITAYAAGAKKGIVYLRYEYLYLKEYLEDVLQQMRNENLLGNNILGKEGFDFDIRIQIGAGAYVCGEESALIESLEGKRGEPRNRPPFPVQKGYLDKPTAVNNVETYCNIVKIILNGADWYKAMGTKESSGTKLMSISGDCAHPGVYELEWGTTVNEMLTLVGAKDVQAVQIGGPSGRCVDPLQFDREIAYEDLSTGGSIIVIGKHRDLLREVIDNFMEFFIDESCSSCAPCRAFTPIIHDVFHKILDGKGTRKDIDDLKEWCVYMKNINRCGLGQTATNPILSTIENFRLLYEKHITTTEEYVSEFDMATSVEASCAHVGRTPNIHHN